MSETNGIYNIKPIDTAYKGYLFRSRLEARWAVFFDALNLKWEYEKEGFELDGKRYLPDFYLQTVNMWAEVKPEYPFDAQAYDLVLQLAKLTRRPVLMLAGTPENKPYPAIDRDGFIENYYMTNHHNYPQKEHRFFGQPAPYESAYDDTEAAANLAKSARFEFGANGN